MSGFMGWFLAFVLVIAIFNAEKLPDLKQMLEEKFKNSVDAAKEGSKRAKHKIKQVRSDIENKKAAANVAAEPEENTPEEIEESLKFMGNYLNQNEDSAPKHVNTKQENANWQDSYAEEEKLTLKEPVAHDMAAKSDFTISSETPIVLDGDDNQNAHSSADTDAIDTALKEAVETSSDALEAAFADVSAAEKEQEDPLEKAFK